MKVKTGVKIFVGIVVIGGGLSYLMYQAMQSSWSYYYSVDEFSNSSSEIQSHSLRLAGRVKQGSVTRNLKKMQLAFALAGANSEILVQYGGSVPENFAEDIEVVVEGRLDNAGTFQADTLLTKCESKYKAKVK